MSQTVRSVVPHSVICAINNLGGCQTIIIPTGSSNHESIGIERDNVTRSNGKLITAGHRDNAICLERDNVTRSNGEASAGSERAGTTHITAHGAAATDTSFIRIAFLIVGSPGGPTSSAMLVMLTNRPSAVPIRAATFGSTCKPSSSRQAFASVWPGRSSRRHARSVAGSGKAPSSLAVCSRRSANGARITNVRAVKTIGESVEILALRRTVRKLGAVKRRQKAPSGKIGTVGSPNHGPRIRVFRGFGRRPVRSNFSDGEAGIAEASGILAGKNRGAVE